MIYEHESPKSRDADEILALPYRRAEIAHRMAAFDDLADPAASTDGQS